jgi:putative membrane protein
MVPTHQAHAHGGDAALEVVLPVGALIVLAVGYLVLAHRRSREAQGWSPWRTASFLAGVGMLIAALVPQLSPLPPGSFAEHMHQHLLIGMYAPLALVLGAPVTLLLRSLPHRQGRVIGRALASSTMGVLAHPVTALVLNLGGLYLLYFTPLYVATTQDAGLHHLVHVHFLVAGYLFAYAIAGPDPAPHRPGVPARLVVLGVAITGHAVLAQLLYAGAFVRGPVPADDLRAGADLMYYAGDLAELLLAFAMVSTWRPRRTGAARRAALPARTLRPPSSRQAAAAADRRSV